MRQLNVYVPRDRGVEVIEAARAHEAIHLACSDAEVEEKPFALVNVCLSNAKVEPFLERLAPIEELRVTFFPQGVLALKPPASEAPDQVADVERRSPIETFLAGHQSIGAWTGFLGYAAAAGVVVWTGLFVGMVFLLTAAMLIAPFAGPAMNTAIATASGDGRLLRKSLLRYVAALVTTAGATEAGPLLGEVTDGFHGRSLRCTIEAPTHAALAASPRKPVVARAVSHGRACAHRDATRRHLEFTYFRTAR